LKCHLPLLVKWRALNKRLLNLIIPSSRLESFRAQTIATFQLFLKRAR
jgi:hypothetical protein